MRLLVLGVSAMALGACSVGGGYSWDQGGFGGAKAHNAAAYGHGDYGYQAGYASGYPASSCDAPAPVVHYAPSEPAPCAAYAAPVYEPIQPVVPAPLPLPAPQPCGHIDPCAGSYSVAYDTHGSTPSAHAYGTQASYGGYAPSYGSGGTYKARNTAGHLYGTLGAVLYDVDEPFGGLQARIGYQATPLLGGELEGSFGIVDDSASVTVFDPNNPGAFTVQDVDFGVDNSVAAFATVGLPIAPRIKAMGRVGYHKTSIEAVAQVQNGTAVKSSDSFDGLAYGGALVYDLSPKDGIRADYTRYDLGPVTSDSVSLAYLRRF